MKSYSSWFIFVGVAVLLQKSCFGVPVSVLNNDISNSAEEEEEEDDIPVLDDDFTTRGLERLSSAATCLVAGVEYTHGQQIYRSDPCEFCLCLDGEMFCWWQDCPPTMEGPCRDRGPFSPCLSVPANPLLSSTSTSSSEMFSSSKVDAAEAAAALPPSTTTMRSSHESSSNSSSVSPIQTTTLKNDTADYEDTSTATEETEQDTSSSEALQESSTSQAVPKKCVVMGREYQIGDKLPHNTGNCVECVCGTGAKVTCSPHQCAPAGDEINDYHLPGARQLLPVDIF